MAGRAASILLMAGLVLAVQGNLLARPPHGYPGQPPSQRERHSAPAQQQPIFRAGANFVRVDAYPTQDGRPVEDLTATEFEIYEDGVLQKIEAFERVSIQAGGSAVTRVEPQTALEANQLAGDPRARLFVVFLDTHHVKVTSSAQIRRPLIDLLQRIIAQDDLVAMMTPEMSAADLMFTRRTDQLESMLDANPFWGARDRLVNRDPVEQQYEYCYPVDPAVSDGHRVTSWIAEEMIARRREIRSLDALEDLVVRLEGIREERKAILLVSEGYARYRASPELSGAGGKIQRPDAPLSPPRETGTTVPRDSSVRGSLAACDADRVRLANLDNERRFQDLANIANRSNATFYPIEPRGLAVFDSDLGPNPPPGIRSDLATLRARRDALQSLATNTDGIAIVNSKDIEGGLTRVVADLSSYYLLGYASTNARLDGRYREIKVRVTRPGVAVRARRGYQAPTEEEVTARAAAPAARDASADAVSDAIARTVSSLDAAGSGAVFRFTVSHGWLTPTGGLPPGTLAGAEPALWMVGEVDVRRPGADDWSNGGAAEVALLGWNHEPLVSLEVPVGQNGRFSLRVPSRAQNVRLKPGSYSVRVRVKPADGGIPSQDTSRFELPAPPTDGRLAMGSPVYHRRGQSTGPREVVTADRRYRRTERIAVELSLTEVPDEVSAELLDRRGQPIAIGVTSASLTKDDAHWARAEAALAPLAAGDYVLRITAKKGTDQVQTLAAFRIIP